MVRQLNPEYVAELKSLLKKSPYFDLIDMELVTLTPGRALFIIPVRDKHTGHFGQVHGGVFASVIDAATFWALWTQVPAENPMTTVELKINYLAPAVAGKDLLAEGRTIKLGRSMGLAEASLTELDTGRVVGFGTTTCMILPPPLLAPLDQMPKKYL